jgi:hypothetical protein
LLKYPLFFISLRPIFIGDTVSSTIQWHEGTIGNLLDVFRDQIVEYLQKGVVSEPTECSPLLFISG